MRISTPSVVTTPVVNSVESAQIENVATQGSEFNSILEQDNKENPKDQLQQAVDSMNKFLEINQTSTRFVYHEGLESYYVTVVDKETDEVIKEIPSKKLLDAFYEMQKLVGNIVDKKI